MIRGNVNVDVEFGSGNLRLELVKSTDEESIGIQITDSDQEKKLGELVKINKEEVDDVITLGFSTIESIEVLQAMLETAKEGLIELKKPKFANVYIVPSEEKDLADAAKEGMDNPNYMVTIPLK